MQRNMVQKILESDQLNFEKIQESFCDLHQLHQKTVQGNLDSRIVVRFAPNVLSTIYIFKTTFLNLH